MFEGCSVEWHWSGILIMSFFAYQRNCLHSHPENRGISLRYSLTTLAYLPIYLFSCSLSLHEHPLNRYLYCRFIALNICEEFWNLELGQFPID